MIPTHSTATLALSAIATISLACGCEDAPAPAPPEEPAATETNAPDLPHYCGAVCKRATQCGIDEAGALTRAGSSTEKKLVAAGQAAAAETERRCVETCAAQPIEAADRARLRDAERCLAAEACEVLMTCLEEAARDS
jgi:hypothetical protein